MGLCKVTKHMNYWHSKEEVENGSDLQSIFEGIIQENFPNIAREVDTQIQESREHLQDTIQNRHHQGI